MREIKFCIGVKNEAGEVSEVILTIDELLDKGLKCEGCEILYKRQFTGIKDTNGAEIYEGDIASCDAFICNLEVYYAEELGMFRFGVDQDDCGDFIEYQSHDFKVIGNIYQNPELLK